MPDTSSRENTHSGPPIDDRDFHGAGARRLLSRMLEVGFETRYPSGYAPPAPRPAIHLAIPTQGGATVVLRDEHGRFTRSG